MTEEQKKARKLSAESGNIRWIKDHCLRTKDGDDDYVFISYKSDDFEKVLDDIVYHACKKYGLKVYFDTAFDDDSDSWIMQYYDNMCNHKCKAFLAFIDDAYYSSYACLLEMMSRKTAAAGGDYKVDSLFFLPINIGSISDITSDSNTGLGTKRFADGKINSHAGEELERFNEIFYEVADDFMRKSIYKREHHTQLYEEATAQSPAYGKMYLNITQCRRLMERVIPKKNDNDGKNKAFVDVIYDKLCNAGIRSVFGKDTSDDASHPKNPVSEKRTEKISEPIPQKSTKPVEKNSKRIPEKTTEPAEKNSKRIPEKTTEPVPDKNLETDGYFYTIFGKEYHAKKREQGNLMYDAYSALVQKYPEKADKLTARISVSRIEDVTNANTPKAKPPYFRTCRKFAVGEHEYYVGTSYDFETKIAEIKRMFKLCGEDASAFVLHSQPPKNFPDSKGNPDGSNHTNMDAPMDINTHVNTVTTVNTATAVDTNTAVNTSTIVDTNSGNDPDTASNLNCFVYTLWNVSHKANKLADMIHDVFDLLKEKYAENMIALAHDDSITAVALKKDVDAGNLTPSKLNYFQNKKEHDVNGVIYYVSARYNREQGINQIKKMISCCEGTADSFQLVSMPNKSDRNNSSAKKGIGELL
ncbi:MAG: toll/interleukin-1 receptor domain-containing protein [bacterium]|nr:toll/interleukin-1 receptor domain-containing protein [bacterium]